MSNILFRIQEISIKENIAITALEKKIGASKGVLSRAMSNGTDIQSKWIQNIVENYPHYSADWLLTGNGPMLKESHYPTEIENREDHRLKEEPISIARHVEGKVKGIPLIPQNAMAGYCSGEQTTLYYECEQYIIPMFKNAEFLITVTGESMQPKFSSGDIVACKKIPLADIFFQWNKVYVLDTSQGALIKRIKKGRDLDHILIVSDNDNYEPFELHKDQINAIAIVIGVVRLE